MFNLISDSIFDIYLLIIAKKRIIKAKIKNRDKKFNFKFEFILKNKVLTCI